jgi:uncharacterized damage-inducible protein DinB
MTDVQTDEVGRPATPLAADEAATLTGFLDYQRATLEWKTRGLSDEQLRVDLTPTSMTLGGLLKHMAYVEDYWFTETVAGDSSPSPWAEVDWKADKDWEWHSAAADSGEQLRALWCERLDRSRQIVARELEPDASAGLARKHSAWGGQGEVSLRWVLVHMIEEYARHNGHADLLRESIDGDTGE